MTRRITQMALVVAVLLLGGSAIYSVAKQTPKVPTETTSYFCPYQTMGRHTGMQPMMMTGRYMSSGMMAGEMNGSGYYCNFTGRSPSTVKPAPDAQAPTATPNKAPTRQP